jgi:hypothetical protein
VDGVLALVASDDEFTGLWLSHSGSIPLTSIK